MPVPVPAPASCMCCRRRRTTTSSGPSGWAYARPPPRWRSCPRRAAAVTFDLMALVTTPEVGRFAGATALAEVMLKMAPPAPLPAAYDTFTTALDALASASPEAIDVAGVRGIWLLLGVLGFEPSLVACVRDGTAIAP